MEVAQFHQHILRQLPAMSADELVELTAAFTLRKVKKRQFIVQPGFTADHRIYVVQGAFRAYVIDPAGVEHTIQFAVEDWWITDVNSYLFRTPAQMFIEALEDSTIFEVEYATEQRLLQSNRRFETLFRLQAERAAAYHQRRLISALTRTAEERYEEFLAKYPAVVQRLPQYVIASYLGMTKGFLSRIRKHGGARKA
ncbi:cAMP-binding domain of CRP or a regulatory subunit of cAMP-dependent protein kinases [Hymenobacter gelipurpurascens]|uniref:cAMP-binding domain of CRP or a regulatory subunit of cAMP-dependent protein kinases n=1 Tax=Hymenobacter gelipurpurascens TaxID=89968 RepID=A0A212TGS4_9BACT|nr:Crp/Fnr family transcriptional regulator [Hymenobacter gelipurpurascens]SNC65239.1 cAMP-binding domain of CRP or a regulatory subunit of cAMP-dependent protein kinases [Hymenobacter gelipurpurascens]